MMDLINLSSKLISFKSISPQSAGSIEFVEKFLKKIILNVSYSSLGVRKSKIYMQKFQVEAGQIYVLRVTRMSFHQEISMNGILIHLNQQLKTIYSTAEGPVI